MSQPTEVKTTKEKSTDKKEIAEEEEEREKMLNAENTRHDAGHDAPDAAEEQRPKRKIPIGGIKMPGFCRTKSREPCKDDETKPSESADPEIPKKDDDPQPPITEKPTTPAKGSKDGKEVKEGKEKEGRRGILNAIRLPLVSVFPRKKGSKDAGDAELGTTGAAGLASVETLDDPGATGEKTARTNDDGMETVRLDGDAADAAAPPPKRHAIFACLSAARKNLFVTVGTLLIFLIMIIILGIACAGPRREPSAPLRDARFIEAVTSCGPVEGVLEDNGGYAFRGIPYAVPPVESRRWLPAEPLRRLEDCWTGTLKAHEPSKKCWQREASGAIDGVEDCLHLDVFTPYVRYDSPIPVVVMIGAETLSGVSPGVMQPSAKLAKVREVVFVRPNFRLGIFGFLAAEPLSRSTHPPTSGNYGLSDIIVALQWVSMNIEHFGGDSRSVTLWGHRAGGTLVTALLGSPKAKNLFSRAWVSSGGALFPGKPLQESERNSKQFLESIKCSDAACLRQKTAEDIMDAVPSTWHVSNTNLPDSREGTIDNRHEWLVLDNAILQDHVSQIWKRSGFPVKVVMGTTAHAGTPAKLRAPNATLTAIEVEKIVGNSILGSMGLANETLRRYNATLEGLAMMVSDIRVVCPLLTVALQNPQIPFYVVTQPRGATGLADVDSDAAAILGSYMARTSEEKRYVSAMRELFNHYVWHDGEVKQISGEYEARKILLVGQDVLPGRNYSNCDFWISKDIVPRYARAD